MTEEKGIIQVTLKRKSVSRPELPAAQPSEHGDFIMLKVTDDGRGISKENLKRIFDPYFTTKEVGKGTGLGLSIVQGIAQDCKGFVKATSKVGEGTAIAVYLPAHEKNAVQPDEMGSDKPGSTEQIQPRILVVDDEPLLVHINKKRLESRGWKVEAFTDSTMALEAFRAQPDSFDVLITDQTMPKMTGKELAEAALQIYPSLPIILCTGHSGAISEDKALSLGISKYVQKPLHADELLDAVEGVLKQLKL